MGQRRGGRGRRRVEPGQGVEVQIEGGRGAVARGAPGRRGGGGMRIGVNEEKGHAFAPFNPKKRTTTLPIRVLRLFV